MWNSKSLVDLWDNSKEPKLGMVVAAKGIWLLGTCIWIGESDATSVRDIGQRWMLKVMTGINLIKYIPRTVLDSYVKMWQAYQVRQAFSDFGFIYKPPLIEIPVKFQISHFASFNHGSCSGYF